MDEVGFTMKYSNSTPSNSPVGQPSDGDHLYAVLTLWKIEALVTLAVMLHVILVMLGSYRRRSSSSFLRLVLWAAFTIPNILVPYAIGLMNSANFKNKLFVVWATFLIIVLGSASSISAYSLKDNEQWKKIKLAQLVQIFWAWWLLILYAKERSYAACLGILLFFGTLKLADTHEAFQSASLSYGVASNSKLVADYMQSEQDEKTRPTEFDPVSMRGYRYLVAGEEWEETETKPPHYRMGIKQTDKVITVEKVWQCEGALLTSGDRHGKLKDICLSFALFKLLRRRCAGYKLAECDQPETRNLVLHGLLSSSSEKGEERTFRVIESEIAFFYDSFYTKYPVIFSKWTLMLAKSLLMLQASLVAIVFIFLSDREKEGDEAKHLSSDIPLTFVVVLSLYSMEYWQIIAYLLSDWAKVLAVCTYIRYPSLQRISPLEKVVGFFCRRRILNCWKRRLGQYSLLTSSGYTPCKLRLWIQGLLLMEKTRNGQKKSREIRLTNEVKKAIAFSLKKSECNLSNGSSSLQRNEVLEHFEWALKLETHTHTILAWHIATEICYIARQDKTSIYNLSRYWRIVTEICGIGRQGNTSSDNINVEVANNLSRYCAYLVAFAPELLPDHKFVTSCIFDEVIKEASKVGLKGFKKLSKKKKYEKLNSQKFSDETLVGKGAKLGREIIDKIKDDTQRWEVLAGFWAEMALFLAPSDNTMAHVEHLARGGEFITHLWALLTHAGVLERPTDARSPVSV